MNINRLRRLVSPLHSRPFRRGRCGHARVLSTEQLEERRLLAIINIDPGGYGGNYNPAGQGLTSGPSTLDLSPGTYNIVVAESGSFSFDVDGTGNVTSNNVDAASAFGNTLTFNTTNVDVNPGAFSGTYQLVRMTSFVSGPQTFVVVPNINNYRLKPGDSSGFHFDVAANGDVTSQNTVAASAAGNTLTLNTTTININPGTFGGSYELVQIFSFSGGLQSFDVVPNVDNYRLKPGDSSGFRFDVAANGDITSDNPDAASGAANMLTFSTITINVDPGAFTGTYQLAGISSFVAGLQSFVVVPNVDNYRLKPGDSSGFRFDVAVNGDVTSDNPDAASGVGNTLTLSTIAINVDPGAFAGTYQLPQISSFVAGLQSFVVVRNVDNYRLKPGDSSGFRFDVAANGDVTSDNPDAASGVGNTLTLSTITINVDPGAYGGGYQLALISTSVSGIQTFVVVPNVNNYLIQVAGLTSFRFDVDAAGQPSPSSVPVTINDEDYTFLLSTACSLAVITITDGGPGSLRDAIVCANSTPGPDSITIGPGTYTLSITGAGEDAAATGDLDVTDDLTIVGAGAGSTIIDAPGLDDRAFHVLAGTTANITGVTIQGGSTDGVGGGLLTSGTLSLIESVVSGNTASSGGGIYNYGDTYSGFPGSLAVIDSTVAGNTADSYGGGISNHNGTTSLLRSTVTGNIAPHGGGILNSGDSNPGSGGALTLMDSSVTGNSAYYGGGINNFGAGANATVSGSTISGNTAQQGGGILNYDGADLLIEGSTISGNHYRYDLEIYGSYGGGVNSSFNSTATITGSVISGNTAQRGGGLYVYNATSDGSCLICEIGAA